MSEEDSVPGADSEPEAQGRDRLLEVIKKVEQEDPEAATVIQQHLAVQQVSHEGPMPSPEDLQKYGEVQSDLPERMMAMAENSLNQKAGHNTKLLELKEKEIDLSSKEARKEERNHKRETCTQRISLVFALLVVLICILGSFYMAIEGHKALSITVGGTTVVGVVGAFLRNSFRNRSE